MGKAVIVSQGQLCIPCSHLGLNTWGVVIACCSQEHGMLVWNYVLQ